MLSLSPLCNRVMGGVGFFLEIPHHELKRDLTRLVVIFSGDGKLRAIRVGSYCVYTD